MTTSTTPKAPFAAAIFAIGLLAHPVAGAQEQAQTGADVDLVGVAGCWRGEVFEDGIGEYPLVLEIADDEASGQVTFYYPNMECVGVLTRSSGGAPGAALFDERIVLGACVDFLQVRASPTGTGVLFEEIQFGETVVAGDLRPLARESDGACRLAPALST